MICRLQLGLLFQHDRQQHRLSRSVPGTVDGVEAGELVEIRLYQVTPRPVPKYLIGAGMHGAHRYDEAAIGGGDLAATPDLGQFQLALRPTRMALAADRVSSRI